MSTSDLKKLRFILGVEENWDMYYEVPVKFIKLVSAETSEYYLFSEMASEKFYYLKPRYIGQQIEDVIVEKQLVVNVYGREATSNPIDNHPLIAYATGLLKLLND